MKFFATLLLLAVSWVSAHDQNTPITLCGRQLARARVLLCFGAETVEKRGNLPHYLLDNLTEDYDDQEVQEWPWANRHGTLTPWNRYKRQGLADECCLKPCTTSLILKYC